MVYCLPPASFMFTCLACKAIACGYICFLIFFFFFVVSLRYFAGRGLRVKSPGSVSEIDGTHLVDILLLESSAAITAQKYSNGWQR